MENNNFENIEALETGNEENSGIFDKIKTLPLKIIIPVVAVVLAVVLAVSILPSVLGNTYKTPINSMVQILNSKKYISPIDQNLKMLNGFAKSEYKEIYNLLKKSENYIDDIADLYNYDIEPDYLQNSQPLQNSFDNFMRGEG